MKRLPALLVGLLLAPSPRPDAVVVTRAMTASTIAEIFVEKDRVRVALEIGVPDLPAFANLLPGQLLERMGLELGPLEERLPRFFAEDWTFRTGDGALLSGYVESMEGRRRLVRDEITGEPLPNQPDDVESVVHAELVFPLSERPAQLILEPPERDGARASVGFVLYHRGLPVNDFRYLAGEPTVDLDWDDPWYSRFRHKNLLRQYLSPVSAYLYVEHFEVRKEVVVRPQDLQRWTDLGLGDTDVIRAEDWGTVKQRAADFLMARCPVRIDGREVQPVLDRVHFIERTLRTSRVLTEPQDLDLLTATMGVIFAYPITGLPEEVTMDWELFDERVERIPAASTDEAGALPGYLTPDDRVLRWQNFLTNPSVPGLVAIEAPPAPPRLHVPVVAILSLLGALVVVLRGRDGLSGGRLATAGVLVLVAAVTWPHARVSAKNPFAGEAVLAEEDAGRVLVGLLRNVYRAFDYREEGQIYDTLAQSTSGELLTDVYLETRRALELENQGGARVKVNDVELVTSATRPAPAGKGFVTRATWNVTGSVGHWGHIHQRRNRYEAELTVQEQDGAWRITALELLDEERL